MKKAFQILGIIFAALLVLIIGVVGYAGYKGKQLDASSQQYIDAAVPAIVSNWTESELAARSAPQLVQATTPEQLAKMFKWFSNGLGPMKKYCGAKGASNVFISPQQGKTTSARYTACAQFEKGNATIEVALIQRADTSWAITGFRVNSPALLPP